jgi:hypothetical protein
MGVHMSTTLAIVLAVLALYLGTCVRQFRKLSRKD